MNIHRPTPLDSSHASWRFSNEKNMAWGREPSEGSARELVAERTGMHAPGAEDVRSPWLSDRVTACGLYPTMKLMSAETAVRRNGGPVSN